VEDCKIWCVCIGGGGGRDRWCCVFMLCGVVLVCIEGSLVCEERDTDKTEI
jgi:hypothetical protein